MTLRSLKREILAGRMKIVPGTIQVPTKFQEKRLVEAIATARLYLSGGTTVEQIARVMGVTAERTAQKIRLGVKYMQQEGWILPADAGRGRVSAKGRTRPA